MPFFLFTRARITYEGDKQNILPVRVRRGASGMNMAMTGGAEAAELGPAMLLHAEVYRTLRRRFATGKITPGSGLSTRGIAEELGVSQMPVREALGRLSADGAIEIRARRKILIAPMSPQRMAEVLQCRLLLEPELAKSALPSIDAQRTQALRETHARLCAASARGDVSAALEANYDFHFGIYGTRSDTTLFRLVEILWLQFGPYSGIVPASPDNPVDGDQHNLAIAAIERGDADALAEAIRRDIEDGMAMIGYGVRRTKKS
jgi:DNA-binding GntR family transcriptional regulator